MSKYKKKFVKAAKIGDVDALKIFVEEGGDVNAKVNLFLNKEVTAIECAIRFNQEEAVEALINLGSSVNLLDKNEDSLLDIACTKNNPKIVSLLLKAGVDVNFINVRGRTALMIACGRKNLEVIKLLLKYGADVNIRVSENLRDKNDQFIGYTALDFMKKDYLQNLELKEEWYRRISTRPGIMV